MTNVWTPKVAVATGLMQGVFAIWQLQGSIKKHFNDDQLQVNAGRAKRGAIHSHAGTGTYVSVSVLEREG